MQAPSGNPTCRISASQSSKASRSSSTADSSWARAPRPMPLATTPMSAASVTSTGVRRRLPPAQHKAVPTTGRCSRTAPMPSIPPGTCDRSIRAASRPNSAPRATTTVPWSGSRAIGPKNSRGISARRWAATASTTTCRRRSMPPSDRSRPPRSMPDLDSRPNPTLIWILYMRGRRPWLPRSTWAMASSTVASSMRLMRAMRPPGK